MMSSVFLGTGGGARGLTWTDEHRKLTAHELGCSAVLTGPVTATMVTTVRKHITITLSVVVFNTRFTAGHCKSPDSGLFGGN